MLRTAALTVLAALVGIAAAVSCEPVRSRPAAATATAPSGETRAADRARPRVRPPAAMPATDEPAPATEAPPAADAPGPAVDVRVVHGETGETLDVPVTVTSLPAPGRFGRVELALDAPHGLVPADAEMLGAWATVRSETQVLRATVVLVPAVRVVLRPAPEFRGRVRKSTLHVGDRPVASTGRRPLVFEVPRHAGARLAATIETAEAEGRGTAVIAPGAERVEIAIPYPARGERSVGAACRGAPSVRSSAWKGTGTLTLHVFDSSGAPSRGANVRLEGVTSDDRRVLREAKTDDAGAAVLTRLPGCRATIQVLRRRGLPSRLELDVRPDESAERRVDEPVATAVTVSVADGDGRPVAFARVEPRFDGRHLVSTAGGVQDLSPLTDVTGTCTLRGMPPAGVDVTVRKGGAEAVARQVAPGRFEAVLAYE